MIDSAHTPIDKWSFTFVGDELGADDAHVWRASLDQPADMIAKLAPLLSRDEYQRAERFHRPTDRRGCVAKNMLGHKNTERRFSSGGNIEEIGHESNLSANVTLLDSFNLPLPNHVHDLIAADGPPRRVETEEAESGIDSTFYESVILLDYVIEVFAAA